jgi:hypothetical protein
MSRNVWLADRDFGGQNLIAVAVTPLVIVALLEPVAPVLRQTLPAVPFLAQVFFVLRREILPTLIVALNSIFLFGREFAPVIVGGRRGIGRQQQKQSKPPGYRFSHFHHITKL